LNENVNKIVDATHNVASYDDDVEMLKSKSRIVVTDCICRKGAELVEKGCSKSMEARFMFGSMEAVLPYRFSLEDKKLGAIDSESIPC